MFKEPLVESVCLQKISECSLHPLLAEKCAHATWDLAELNCFAEQGVFFIAEDLCTQYSGKVMSLFSRDFCLMPVQRLDQKAEG